MNIRKCVIAVSLGLSMQGCSTNDIDPGMTRLVECDGTPPANACGRAPMVHSVTFDINSRGMPSNLLPDELPNVCTQDSITWQANGAGSSTFPFNIIFVGDNAPMPPGQLVTASSGGSLTVGPPFKNTGNPNNRECLDYSVFVKPADGTTGGVIDPVVILER